MFKNLWRIFGQLFKNLNFLRNIPFLRDFQIFTKCHFQTKFYGILGLGSLILYFSNQLNEIYIPEFLEDFQTTFQKYQFFNEYFDRLFRDFEMFEKVISFSSQNFQIFWSGTIKTMFLKQLVKIYLYSNIFWGFLDNF